MRLNLILDTSISWLLLDVVEVEVDNLDIGEDIVEEEEEAEDSIIPLYITTLPQVFQIL